MLTENEPDVGLTFDEKMQKHVWKYYPKKNDKEMPTLTELVNFRDEAGPPEVDPEVETSDESSDESSSDNDESVPEVICQKTKTKSILKSKPGPNHMKGHTKMEDLQI